MNCTAKKNANSGLYDETHKGLYTFSDIIGESEVMHNLRRSAEKFCMSNEPILILGESGTGKELLAHAMHNASPRRDRQFICVNCAAIPASLAESELFGYTPGAFTGACSKGMKGKFEQAEGGTVFLDEIAELPLSIQAKLLRVLESGEIQKLGASHNISTNFRLIAATNHDLMAMVQHSKFREDLYYRINVFEIDVPPLRDRNDDIFLLTDFFLEKYLGSSHGIIISDEIETIFRHYSWPGNIRELKNTILYIIHTLNPPQKVLNRFVLPKRLINTINPEMYFSDNNKFINSKYDDDMEKLIIKSVLQKHRYNKLKSAKELGFSRSKLYRKICKYGL